MKVNELKRKLKSNGCYCETEKTNHEWWFSHITNQHFSIPRHGSQEVPLGTLKSISKQSGFSL